MLAYPLFSKLVTPGESSVPRDVVEAWLNKHHALRVAGPVILAWTVQFVMACMPWQARWNWG